MDQDEDMNQPRRSVRLSVDEAWATIEASHTGIFTTVRRDGTPVALPLWFVVVDREIYLRTGADSKKAIRARHNPRASFLVESGERWAELQAVHLTGTVDEAPAEPAERAAKAFDDKYTAFRTASSKMSQATRAHYATPRVFLRFRPDERIVSWDNRRLGL